jgi:hypothetical protein
LSICQPIERRISMFSFVAERGIQKKDLKTFSNSLSNVDRRMCSGHSISRQNSFSFFKIEKALFERIEAKIDEHL